jgi:hypothetical protein
MVFLVSCWFKDWCQWVVENRGSGVSGGWGAVLGECGKRGDGNSRGDDDRALQAGYWRRSDAKLENRCTIGSDYQGSMIPDDSDHVNVIYQKQEPEIATGEVATVTTSSVTVFQFTICSPSM